MRHRRVSTDPYNGAETLQAIGINRTRMLSVPPSQLVTSAAAFCHENVAAPSRRHEWTAGVYVNPSSLRAGVWLDHAGPHRPSTPRSHNMGTSWKKRLDCRTRSSKADRGARASSAWHLHPESIPAYSDSIAATRCYQCHGLLVATATAPPPGCRLSQALWVEPTPHGPGDRDQDACQLFR